MKMIFALILSFMFNIAQAHILLKDGGISGGGGNVISPTAPDHLQDPYDIKIDIMASRSILQEFLIAKLDLFRVDNMSSQDKYIYSILFQDTEHGIIKAMKEVPIFIPVYEPCYDLAGRQYDGVAVNSDTHAVCISAFNLALKVDKSDIPVQAAGLLLHELSEVAGLSDEVAIYLQNQLLKEYRN